MKASRVPSLWIAAAAFAGALAANGVQAQATDLRPPGNQDTEDSEEDLGQLREISDDPDPFGSRFGAGRRFGDYRVWSQSPTPDPVDPAPARRLVLVLDPATGAIVGLEVVPATIGKIPRGFLPGADGRLRLILSPPAHPSR